MIPSPGGMGSYHALIVLGLSIYGISNIEAFSFANIAFFSIQLGANLLGGIIALITLPLINASINTKAHVSNTSHSKQDS